MVMFNSYVSLPEGKPPCSYGFPMVFPLKQGEFRQFCGADGPETESVNLPLFRPKVQVTAVGEKMKFSSGSVSKPCTPGEHQNS